MPRCGRPIRELYAVFPADAFLGQGDILIPSYAVAGSGIYWRSSQLLNIAAGYIQLCDLAYIVRSTEKNTF